MEDEFRRALTSFADLLVQVDPGPACEREGFARRQVRFHRKAVRGRLTVSFHSGMSIRRFYNELSIRSGNCVTERVKSTMVEPLNRD